MTQALGVFHHDLFLLNFNLFVGSPLQYLASREGLLCVRSGGAGASLPSGFLWICLNMLLYQSLGLFTLLDKKRWESAEGKHIFGVTLWNTAGFNKKINMSTTKSYVRMRARLDKSVFLSYWSGGNWHPCFIHWANSLELYQPLLSGWSPAAW